MKNPFAKEPLSTSSVWLFIALFAINIVGMLPTLTTPIATLAYLADPTPFFVPAALYAAFVVAAAAVLLRRKSKKPLAWLRWVAVPAIGLVLCLFSMASPEWAVVLAVYAGVAILAQVIVLSFFGGPPY